jgi:hypothetical protein
MSNKQSFYLGLFLGMALCPLLIWIIALAMVGNKL